MAIERAADERGGSYGRGRWRCVAALSSVLAALAVVLVVAGCGPSAPGSGVAQGGDRAGGGRDRLRVVCTTAMVGDLVRGVAGDSVEVTVLMGPGVDPHLYRPTRTDVAAIMEADVVFYNGLLLEGKMTDTLVRAASGGRTVWPVTELIPEDQLMEPEGMAGHADPHVWMDPQAWVLCVEVVRSRLAEKMPGQVEALAERAAEYEAEIRELHAYAAGVLGSVPEGRRVLVTSHDAFNYFGRRYGLEVVGIQGISTESEAGVRDVERLVDLIVTRGILAVFVETTVSDRNITALVDGAGARGHAVRIGGSLYSDAMGAPGTYEGTYIGMIDHNVTTVARALGGEAPEGGMSGRLGSRVMRPTGS